MQRKRIYARDMAYTVQRLDDTTRQPNHYLQIYAGSNPTKCTTVDPGVYNHDIHAETTLSVMYQFEFVLSHSRQRHPVWEGRSGVGRSIRV